MNHPSIRPAGWPASPIGTATCSAAPSARTGSIRSAPAPRRWAEVAIDEGHWDLALELAEYFASEIGDHERRALRVADRHPRLPPRARPVRPRAALGHTLLRGLSRASSRAAATSRAPRRPSLRTTPVAATTAIELMRVRWAAQHDGLVVWIQEVLTEIADSFGEDAIRESVTLAYEHIWKPRYAAVGADDPRGAAPAQRGGHARRPPLRPASSRRRRRLPMRAIAT